MNRASHGNDEIGDIALVAHILRDQLCVTQEQFWDAVDNGDPVQRADAGSSTASADEAAHDLPEWLAVRLAVQVGLSDREIAELDEGEALGPWKAWCSRPSG